MIVLSCVKAILKNSFFYLEPYVHQIINMILSFILMEVDTQNIELVIKVKDFAVKLMNKVYKK